MIVDVHRGGPGADRHALASHLLRERPQLAVLDYGDAVVGPGLIDVHVHMNEPGREEWEGGRRVCCAAGRGVEQYGALTPA